MISDTELDGPGRETAPAFSDPVIRDFDGGLLQRWTFVLTATDALAVLRLRRKLTGRDKIKLGSVCFAGGVISALMPWGSGLVRLLATESALFALLFVARDLMRRRTAAQLMPQTRPGVLEEWVDCIAGSEIDSPDEAYLSPELIGQVQLTRTHLFIRSHLTTIVVPRHAFADATEAEQLAAHITQLTRGPYYFDAALDDAPPDR